MPGDARPRGARSRLASLSTDRAGLLAVLLAPLIAVAALRAPLVNQLSYPDAWFYSGHGWQLATLIENFGFSYYSVRFPAILPIDWSSSVLGPVGGYLALRYAILVATGAVVYALFRRFASRPVAAATVVLLALTPFYLRGVLWDYTTYVMIPASIAAIAAWHLGTSRRARLGSAATAGGLVSVAMFANAVAFPVVFAIAMPEAVAALRGGRAEIVMFVQRGIAAIGGAIAVFLGGWLLYRLTLGGLSPGDLVEPTLNFLDDNERRAAPFQVPASEWLRSEPRVYAPVVVILALVIAMRGRILGTDVPARVAQAAVVYTGTLWAYRWLMTSSVIETWWAYSATAVTIVLGLGVLAHEWTRRGEEDSGARLAVAMVAAAAVTGVVIRLAGDGAVSFYDEVRTSTALLVALLLVTVAVAVVATSAHVGRATGAAALLAALVMMWGLTPAGKAGVANTGDFGASGTDEIRLYGASEELMDLVSRSEPDRQVLLLSDFTTEALFIGWSALPHQGGGIQDPFAQNPIDEPSAADLRMLRQPTTAEVVIVAETRREAAAAVAPMRAAGVAPRVIARGEWAGGRVHYVHVVLRNPGGGS